MIDTRKLEVTKRCQDMEEDGRWAVALVTKSDIRPL